MEISWTDRVRNKWELHRFKEDINILFTINKKNGNWIGHILTTNCLLKRVIEGNIEGRIEGTGIPRRRRRLLLDDLKKMRIYWKLNEEALDFTL